MRDARIIIPSYTSDGLQQFVNGGLFHGRGAGFEVSGKPLSFLQLDANFEQQQAQLDGATPANSPSSLGKLRGSIPLHRNISISSALLYQSERTTLAGAILPPVYLGELSVVGKSFQAGIRNIANTRYSDPVGLTSTVDTMLQPGRTFFLTVTFAR
jgi:outer membrane receptor protein involved in Fe transport